MKNILAYVFLLNLSTALYANSPTNIHNNIMANYLQFEGKTKQAYELYKSLLGGQAPIYVYKGYIHLLYDTANFPHIVQLIPQLDPVFEHDPAIQLIFAQALEKIGNLDQADGRYIKLNDRFKHNQEIAFNAANSYLRRKEPENALQVIDNLLNSSSRKANNFIFHFMKAQIYIQLNKKKEALKSVQKSLEMHPKFDKGWLFLALLHEQEGQLNDAIKGYTNFLEVTDSPNKEVEQHLLQIVFKQKIKNNETKNKNKVCLDSALRLFEEKKYQKALEAIDECIKKNPKNSQNKLLKIEVLAAMGLKDKAALQLKEWIEQSPQNNLWYKILHLLTQVGLDAHVVITYLKDIEKNNPQTVLPTLYLSDLFIRTQNTKEALKYLHKVRAAAKNKKLQEKILFQIAFLHYDLKQFKQFERIAQQALKANASYPPLLNLIAYYRTVDNPNLAQAQTLIDKALKADANNPHFLDTQAMIYVQQHKLDLALPILEKIAQKVPNDYTILIHLAQAKHQTGKVHEAIKILKTAHNQAKTAQETKESKLLLGLWKTKKQSNTTESVS